MKSENKRLLKLLGLLVISLAFTTNFLAGQYEIYMSEYQKMPFGSYLLSNSVVDPKEPTKKRVIFVGNSVLHYTQIVEMMTIMKDKEGPKNWEFLNFGYVAATLGDYFLIYEHIKKFEPDLIVFQFNPSTFSEGQLLRTDLKDAILMPEYSHLLSEVEFKNFYKREDYIDSFIYSYLPITRFFPIWRFKLKETINGITGTHIMNFFPWSLNRFGEWNQSQAAQFKDLKDISEAEYTYPLLKKLYQSVKANNQKAIYINLESPYKTRVGFSKFMEEDKASIFDLQNFYRKEEFADHLHHNKLGSAKTARRVLDIVRERL